MTFVVSVVGWTALTGCGAKGPDSKHEVAGGAPALQERSPLFADLGVAGGRFVLDGSVRNAVTGEPISDFQVRVVKIPLRGIAPRRVLGEGAGGEGTFQIEFSPVDGSVLLAVEIRAEGFLPIQSEVGQFEDLGGRLNFWLWPGGALNGRVLGPDGAPVAGAKVRRVFHSTRMHSPFTGLRHNFPESGAALNLGFGIDNEVLAKSERLKSLAGVTDERGQFSLGEIPVPLDRRAFLSNPGKRRVRGGIIDVIVVMSKSGYVVVPTENLRATGEVQLRPLAQMELEVATRAGPIAGRKVEIRLGKEFDEPDIGFLFRATTDGKGTVRFQDIPPGAYRVFVDVPNGRSAFGGEDYFELRGEALMFPGESRTIRIGTEGFVVRGRFVAPNTPFEIHWPSGKVGSSHRDARMGGYLEDVFLMNGSRLIALEKEADRWRMPDRGWVPGFSDSASRSSEANSDKRFSRREIIPDVDGMFELEGVVPGHYQLQFAVTQPRPEISYRRLLDPDSLESWEEELLRDQHVSFRFTILPGTVREDKRKHKSRAPISGGDLVGYVNRLVVVPAKVEGGVMDLGTIDLVTGHVPEEGEQAPPISGRGYFSEEQFDSNSLLGRRVLVGFCNGGLISSENMRVFGELLEEELGDGSEMVLVTALLADSPENLPKSWDSHEGRNGPWREVYVGEWDSSSVAEQYGFLTTPTFFVIGADGTIEAADLNIIQAFRRVKELFE